jgi:hypothetical protein
MPADGFPEARSVPSLLFASAQTERRGSTGVRLVFVMPKTAENAICRPCSEANTHLRLKFPWGAKTGIWGPSSNEPSRQRARREVPAWNETPQTLQRKDFLERALIRRDRVRLGEEGTGKGAWARIR